MKDWFGKIRSEMVETSSSGGRYGSPISCARGKGMEITRSPNNQLHMPGLSNHGPLGIDRKNS